SDVALQLSCADQKSARRNQHRAAAITIARVNRRLERRCIQCCSVAFGPIIANVVCPRTKRIAALGGSAFGHAPLTCKGRPNCGGKKRHWGPAQPLTPG